MMLVVCCGENVDDRFCVCNGGIIEMKVQVSNQLQLAGCKCEVFKEIGKLPKKYWNVWRLFLVEVCISLRFAIVRDQL